MREALPDEVIAAKVHHGVIADGFTIEVHGYLGVDLEVKATTADAACDLALAEFERQLSQGGQSYVWPPRFDD
jgi:hypothetical protein